MLPSAEDCDDCTMKSIRQASSSSTALSALVFLLTFAIIALATYQKLFPLLSGSQIKSKSDGDAFLSLRKGFTGGPTAPKIPKSPYRPTSRGIAAVTVSVTIALSLVLAELILCEIADMLDPIVRRLALSVTLTSLLVLLIIVIPLLELHATISAASYIFWTNGKGRFSFAWYLEIAGFLTWMAGFWWVGQGLPGTQVHSSWAATFGERTLSEACLERIGVIGISLMALLSGFASVSSLWQNFGQKARRVTDVDIERKQAGLEATQDMLSTKRSRLRALRQKVSNAPNEGFATKLMSSIRGGNADTQELRSLELETAGLETMARTLSTSLASYHDRRRTQQRSSTSTGRLLLLISYGFSIYCLYRIFATSLATLRRWWHPSTTFSGTDPINNFLALLAKHWDPTLDRQAWSQQISFFLSGVILFASFSAVLQTVLFFSRFTPTLLEYVQANLALLVSQISATYVISSALLLRSNLPREVGSVISNALGAPLDSAFVDRWFEGWFLTASALTAIGIIIGRKLGAGNGSDWDDEYDDPEAGDKRS